MNLVKSKPKVLRHFHVFREHGIALHQQIWHLLTSPLFIWITIIFHILIFGCAYLLRYLEIKNNPELSSPINAIYWAFATVTTVGYGDIVPMTGAGKILTILLMMSGSVFTAIYTALFASTILAIKFSQVEEDVRGVKSQFGKFKRDIQIDEEQLRELIENLKNLISQKADV